MVEVLDKLYNRIPEIDWEEAEERLLFRGAGTLTLTVMDPFKIGSALIVADPVILSIFASSSPAPVLIEGMACAETEQFVPLKLIFDVE